MFSECVDFLNTRFLTEGLEKQGMKVYKIQDNGSKFIIRGETGLYDRLQEVFENTGLGISVTESEEAEANILYTENNRDIVLRLLNEHTEKTPS